MVGFGFSKELLGWSRPERRSASGGGSRASQMLRGTCSQGRKRAQNRTRLPVTTAADQTVAAPRSGKPPLPRKPRIASGALLPSTSAPVPLPRWGLNLPSRHPSHTGRGKKTSLQGSHRISSFLRSSSAREGEKRQSSGECSCPPVSRSAQHHQCGAPHHTSSSHRKETLQTLF